MECLGFASKPSGEGCSYRLKQDYLGVDNCSILVTDIWGLHGSSQHSILKIFPL